MAQIKPRAIYIGKPQVGDFLKKIEKNQFEFLPHVQDISSLWTGLENDTISNNIQVIFILDHFFDPKGEDTSFEKLVAVMGPHCFFCILNYHPNLKEAMKERIEYEAYASNHTEGDDFFYFFIDTKKPLVSIDRSLDEYLSKSPRNEAVDILSGRVTVEEREKRLEEQRKKEEEESQFFISDDDDEPNPYLGQVVAVTSSKGGSGKSTVAVSLATFLARASENSVKEGLEEKPLKVVILDLDVRDGQLGFLTGNSKPTVINLRLKGISKDTIEDTIIHSPRLKCDLLLAPKRPRNADDTPPEFYVDLIHHLRKMYDYIILDTSVNYLDPLLEKVAYPTADQIIFVTDIVVNSVFSMTRWVQEVTKPKEQGGMGIQKRKIGIVVNKYLADINMPASKIGKATLGIPVIAAISSSPKLMAHAANMQSMEVALKHKDIYPSIRRIARSVTGKKYKLSDNVA